MTSAYVIDRLPVLVIMTSASVIDCLPVLVIMTSASVIDRLPVLVISISSMSHKQVVVFIQIIPTQVHLCSHFPTVVAIVLFVSVSLSHPWSSPSRG